MYKWKYIFIFIRYKDTINIFNYFLKSIYNSIIVIKSSFIIKSLNKKGCNVTIVPYNTTYERIEDLRRTGAVKTCFDTYSREHVDYPLYYVANYPELIEVRNPKDTFFIQLLIYSFTKCVGCFVCCLFFQNQTIINIFRINVYIVI